MKKKGKAQFHIALFIDSFGHSVPEFCHNSNGSPCQWEQKRGFRLLEVTTRILIKMFLARIGWNPFLRSLSYKQNVKKIQKNL